MAIKIIEQQELTCTCRRCKSKLSFIYSDTFEKVVSDYTGDKDTYTAIECPVCKTDIRVAI